MRDNLSHAETVAMTRARGERRAADTGGRAVPAKTSAGCGAKRSDWPGSARRRGRRARPPVFPPTNPTMPNGAFVKVSSFTADAARRRAALLRQSLTRRAPSEGRRKAHGYTRSPRRHSLSYTLYYR